MRMADEHLIRLQPGTVLGGRYEVVRCLGAGSMGLVYACKDIELDDRLVAMKVLFPEVAEDKVAAARFRNEIFASYGVSHPNVVRAYEYLRDGDIVAYTMEYVGGGDLADHISKKKEMKSIEKIFDLLSQMCLGVQAIHDAGIIHRDLKPENILLTEDGNIKIADFGIARTTQGPKLTEHGGVVGTIDYVSPEYMLNSHVDWRSDIYALGILAYEMTTHQSPFTGDSVYATMTKRLKTDPEPPSTHRSDVPPELDYIILKAMAREREQRYQSTKEMREDLQAYLEGKPVRGMKKSGEGSRSSGSTSRVSIQDPDALSMVNDPSGSFVFPSGKSLDSDDQSEELKRARSGTYEFSKEVKPQPKKMQSVLRKSSHDTPGWDSKGAQSSKEINVGNSSLDNRRIQRLSESVQAVNRSIWVDVMTWILAVIIGVGVGFFVLQIFYPEKVAENTQQLSMRDSFEVREY